MATYTVVKGDTLSKIASRFNTTISNLAKLNNIKNVDLIHVGQVLKLDGSATTPSKNNTYVIKIDQFGLQADTDRTVFATWTWERSNTSKYQVRWLYETSDGRRFLDQDTTVSTSGPLQSIYSSAPSNAKKVIFKVRPIAKNKSNGSAYWTADWSTEMVYSFDDNPPVKPDIPSDIIVEKYKLTVSMSNLHLNATEIEFELFKDNADKVAKGVATIHPVTGYASYVFDVEAGYKYTVRCRSKRDTLYSDWSDFSQEYKTIPSTPEGITTIRTNSETSVYLEWTPVGNAETYELEYATKVTHFDQTNQTTIESSIEFPKFEVLGLSGGEEYFFRVRASNSEGTSGWCEPKSVKVGKKPSAPTTWASTTTAISGEKLNLYWVHNTQDGSRETYAEIELWFNGERITHTIKNEIGEDGEPTDDTNVFSIDTSIYPEGTNIRWRVRTKGITADYGEWSVERTVDVYAPPTLNLTLTDIDGNEITELTSFPFIVKGVPGPQSQAPISYHLSVVANETYETVDNLGNVKMVNKGEEVYSKHFDISGVLTVEMSANNISLSNNITYTVTCVVTMNSGLNKTESSDIKVSWDSEGYSPNIEIGIDGDALTAYVRPYCVDLDDNIIEDISLSVYRREFDGSFTELATGLDNTKNIFVTDPHPALDYARYRVVAKTNSTGRIMYYDPPGHFIGEKAIIIQWDEVWSNFDISLDETPEQPAWSGSMLKLPYNIEVSESNSQDVSMVEYIGRKHPVTYYGTHLGTKATWNTTIPKSDKETIYALRRLQSWMGNVYVREPSGTGYWAKINVSFNQKYKEVTSRVTLEVTRVEGGI